MSETKLGRKIEDLIRENEIKFSETEEVEEILIEKIIVNPKQPRKYFNEQSIKELAESIKEHGLLQPIIVKSTNDGYILVAGERRMRAMILLGRIKISAIVREYNEKFLTELAILENIQREDLSPIEEAIAYKNILEDFHITHDKLAERIGKSRSYITNIIGLLKLPKIVMQSVSEGNLSMGHARVLSKLDDEVVVLELFNKTITENLTVRQLEEIAHNDHDKDGIEIINIEYLDDIKTKLEKVVDKDIIFDIKKNKLVFSFKTKNELKKIIDFLSKKL